MPPVWVYFFIRSLIRLQRPGPDTIPARRAERPLVVARNDIFDPFNDRLARDIRNALSVALIQALDRQNPDIARRAARRFLDRALPAPYETYITERLKRYEKVFDEAAGTDVPRQARVMWNLGLYFETHERLETVFHSSSGERRKAYKGMIQAAGAYVHFERGAERSARRLAGKAVDLLRRYGSLLPDDFNLPVLLKKLEEGSPHPPRL